MLKKLISFSTIMIMATAIVYANDQEVVSQEEIPATVELVCNEDSSTQPIACGEEDAISIEDEILLLAGCPHCPQRPPVENQENDVKSLI